MRNLTTAAARKVAAQRTTHRAGPVRPDRCHAYGCRGYLYGRFDFRSAGA
jgi:hypothetical protein